MRGKILWCVYVSFLVFVCEIASREILYINPGVKKISFHTGEELNFPWNAAGKVYRQVGAEFDVLTTIDMLGFRRNDRPGSVGNTLTRDYVLWLGDSFTFGLGVEFDRTFVSLTCEKWGRNCINAGIPGSSAVEQILSIKQIIDILGDPAFVIMVPLVGSRDRHFAGNDFTDFGKVPEEMVLDALSMMSSNGLDFEDGTGAVLNQLKERSIGSVVTNGSISIFFKDLENLASNSISGLINSVLRVSNLARVMKFVVINQFAVSAEQFSRNFRRDPFEYVGFLNQIVAWFEKKEIGVGMFPLVLEQGSVSDSLIDAVIRPLDCAGKYRFSRQSELVFPIDGHFNASGHAAFSEFLLKNHIACIEEKIHE